MKVFITDDGSDMLDDCGYWKMLLKLLFKWI